MTQLPENIVQVVDGKMFTTSLIVAQAFEKEHYNVLRDIENLECSPEFTALNFEASEYKDSTGRTLPAYNLTRDGFAFLAMGFTGKKAAEWKEKFLLAFNLMEAQLTRMYLPTTLIDLPPREADEIRRVRVAKALRGYCAYWAFVDQMPYQVAEVALCAHLGRDRIEDLYDLEREAFDYLRKVLETPSNLLDGSGPTENERIMLKYMLEACSQWRFTRDSSFEEYFEEVTGVKLNELDKLRAHDIHKILCFAIKLLHRSVQYALDMDRLAEDMPGNEYAAKAPTETTITTTATEEIEG